jgi:hypothetical protein
MDGNGLNDKFICDSFVCCGCLKECMRRMVERYKRAEQ